MTEGAPGQTPGAYPSRGAFAASEVLPELAKVVAERNRLQAEWLQAKREAVNKGAEAKVIRANIIVNLRVWGTELTGGVPIKTSAERQEWANADSDWQRLDLEADLAAAVATATRMAYDTADEHMQALRSALGMERDENKWQQGQPK